MTVAAAMVMAVAGGVSAYYRYDYKKGDDGSVKVDNNVNVTVKSYADADTGDNTQTAYTGSLTHKYSKYFGRGGSDTTQRMETGDAWSLAAIGMVDVASTLFGDCDCYSKGDVQVKNRATVYVKADAESETGDNSQMVSGSRRSSSRGDVTQRMFTGDAGSESYVDNVYVGYSGFGVN